MPPKKKAITIANPKGHLTTGSITTIPTPTNINNKNSIKKKNKQQQTNTTKDLTMIGNRKRAQQILAQREIQDKLDQEEQAKMMKEYEEYQKTHYIENHKCEQQ